MNNSKTHFVTSHSIKQRQKIISVAGRLFSKNGYLGTSIEDIAKAASVNKASIYYYFENKSFLLYDVISAHLQGMISMAMEVAASKSQAGVKLEALVKGHVKWQATHSETAGVGHMERKNLPPYLRRKYVDLRDEYEGFFRRTIEEGIKKGEFSFGSSKLAALFTLGLTSSINQWYKQKGDLSADEIADEVWAFILKGLRTGNITQKSPKFSLGRETTERVHK